MKFSESWLRSLVNPAVSRDELVARLSMAGLEVDAVEPVAGALSGVVVGEIMAAEQHPDADKLRVCQVSDGQETFQVVCGAPNARVGIKIPFAKIGAVLQATLKSKKLSCVALSRLACCAQPVSCKLAKKMTAFTSLI